MKFFLQKTDENILLGAVGVDIPVKLLQEFSPKYRVCLIKFLLIINILVFLI